VSGATGHNELAGFPGEKNCYIVEGCGAIHDFLRIATVEWHSFSMVNNNAV
jgi:hypothetical protein